MPATTSRPGAALAALLRLYVDIALWRRGPQDVPAVGILLPLTVAAYVLLSTAIGEALPALRPGWLLQVSGDALFVAAWYWLLLLLMQRRERYLQTATALFGLQTMLAAPSIVSVWLVQRYGEDALWQVPVFLLALALSLWTLVAIACILRASLERSLGLCLTLAFLQMLVEELVFLAIFGSGH
jgi:hypothetical protein